MGKCIYIFINKLDSLVILKHFSLEIGGDMNEYIFLILYNEMYQDLDQDRELRSTLPSEPIFSKWSING